MFSISSSKTLKAVKVVKQLSRLSYVSAPLVPKLFTHFKCVWSEADLYVSYDPAHFGRQKVRHYYNNLC